MTFPPTSRWRIAPAQHLLVEDFDDGVVMFDALAGATHRLDASAAEALAIVAGTPGLDAASIHRRLLARLELADDALPLPAVVELLQHFESLNILRADTP